MSVCIHDSVQRNTLVVSAPAIPPHTARVARRAAPLAILPLRVTPWYLSGESAVITTEQTTQLKTAMSEVTKMISRVLSVRRLEGPLLLNRDINRFCRYIWQNSSLLNNNRCGSLDISYHGETCLDVWIPPSHLRGFEVWSANGTEPSHVTPDGDGVPDTDFLLYVKVAQTEKCAAQTSVIAYASYCQLDPLGRPIAGVIVFCAERLRKEEYNHRHIVQVSLHEILHALGFSSSLFERWIDCSLSEPEDTCFSRSRVTNTDERGQYRIFTPTVMQRMGEHLGGASVGAPLENKDFPASASSHWESRLFQGSILTASLSLPHITQLDPITLAAFTDMGWYRVNTDFKGQLVWGRGAGLSFGLPSTCHDSSSEFFCTGSGLGCHHLHLDKGICATDTYLEGCRIYKPISPGGECWLQQEHGEPEEIFHTDSRCFFSNLTKGTPLHSEIRGHCYLHRCLAPNQFQVKVQGSNWTDCPAGAWIQVAGFDGLLQCPLSRLCMGFHSILLPTLPPISNIDNIGTVKEDSVPPTKPGLHVIVQVTISQIVEWSPEKKHLLLDEVLGVIAQTAGVQR
ncbi:ciliated left-right organizer metallopeptidase [Rhinophrynus dorsalis]